MIKKRVNNHSRTVMILWNDIITMKKKGLPILLSTITLMNSSNTTRKRRRREKERGKW